MDQNKVTALVKITIQKERLENKVLKLKEDYNRLWVSLNKEEYNEYLKRIN